MAHIWKKAGDAWEIEWLTRDRFGFDRPAGPGGDSSDQPATQNRFVRLVRNAPPEGPEQWVLLAAPGAPIRVNGRRVALGLRVLRDRDEIRFDGGEVFYFATERLAVVEPFPGSDRPVICPRCRTEIHAGEPAVRCPNDACAVWYHESPDRACWTYMDSCALCGHPTALDAGFCWTPEEVCA